MREQSNIVAEAGDCVRRAVARHFGTTTINIMSFRQDSSAVKPRWVAIYLMHEVLGFNKNQIARDFRQNWQTVHNALKNIKDDDELMVAAFKIGERLLGQNEGYLPPGEYDEFPPSDSEAA